MWIEGFGNEAVNITPYGRFGCRGVGCLGLQGDGASLASSRGVGEEAGKGGPGLCPGGFRGDGIHVGFEEVAYLFQGGCVLVVVPRWVEELDQVGADVPPIDRQEGEEGLVRGGSSGFGIAGASVTPGWGFDGIPGGKFGCFGGKQRGCRGWSVGPLIVGGGPVVGDGYVGGRGEG